MLDRAIRAVLVRRSLGARRTYVVQPHGHVHVRLAGRPVGEAAPTLVAIHQTPSAGVMFEGLFGRLAHAFALVAPDLPGFGATDPLPSPPRVEDWAEVVLSTIDALGVARFALLGHHAGASVAVEIARRAATRVEALILSSPPLVERATLEAKIPPVAPRSLRRDGGHLGEVWTRVAAKEPDLELELHHREAVLNLLAGPPYADAYRAVLDHDLERALETLAVPTLVLTTPHDPLAAAAPRAAAKIAGARLVTLPKGGTFVFDREPELVAGAIRAFLSNHSTRPPANTAASPSARGALDG